MSSYLEPGEEEIFSESALFGKEKNASLVLTNVRVLIVKKKNILNELKYSQIERIKYTKKEIAEPDEKATAKFRIIDVRNTNFDVTFKGVNSQKALKKSISILKSKKDEAKKGDDNDNNNNGQSSSARRSSEQDQKDHDDINPYNKTPEIDPSTIQAMLLTRSRVTHDEFLDLVSSRGDQIISEDNFWLLYKDDISELSSSLKYQQAGYTGRFLSEVVADSKSRGNQFSFTINDSIKRQILRKKPQVLNIFGQFQKEHFDKKYDGLSPEDESKFWQQYFSAQLIDTTTKVGARKKKKENIFDNVKLKDTVSFNKESREMRYSILEPSVRVGSLYECSLGEGPFNKEFLPSTFQATIDSYNIHSELSLIENGLIPDTTRKLDSIPTEIPMLNRMKDDELEDLKPMKETSLTPLNIIQSPETIVKAASIEAAVFQNVASDFASKINGFKHSFFKLPSPVQPPMHDANCVLRDMTGDISNLYNYQKNSLLSSYISSGLEKLKEHKAKEQVLLFHFWSNYVDTKSDSEEKALKMKEKIKAFREELEEEKRRLTTEDSYRALVPIYEEIQESLSKVCSLYETNNNISTIDDIDKDLSFF